jgi:hypothetical protein
MYVGNKAGPCPNCNGMGSIPDGVYDFVGETLTVVSLWTPGRIARVVAGLERARNAADPRAATEAVLAEEGDLLGLVKRLVIPSDAGHFWALIAAFLALLQLMAAWHENPSVTVNETTVVEQTFFNQQPQPFTKDP